MPKKKEPSKKEERVELKISLPLCGHKKKEVRDEVLRLLSEGSAFWPENEIKIQYI